MNIDMYILCIRHVHVNVAAILLFKVIYRSIESKKKTKEETY